MKSSLAEKLLIKIMDWTAEQISEERPLLQALANLKYDEYQQFSSGMRYIASLAKWLNQFKTVQERRIAYDFVKKQLIFITNEQQNHLVELTFPMKIVPAIVNKVVTENTNISKYNIPLIVNSPVYKEAFLLE